MDSRVVDDLSMFWTNSGWMVSDVVDGGEVDGGGGRGASEEEDVGGGGNGGGGGGGGGGSGGGGGVAMVKKKMNNVVCVRSLVIKMGWKITQGVLFFLPSLLFLVHVC